MFPSMNIRDKMGHNNTMQEPSWSFASADIDHRMDSDDDNIFSTKERVPSGRTDGANGRPAASGLWGPFPEPKNPDIADGDLSDDSLFNDPREVCHEQQPPSTATTFLREFEKESQDDAAHDRSWAAAQARKESLKKPSPIPKRSPKRPSGEEGDDSSGQKKPRRSLFGGGDQEDSDIDISFASDDESKRHTPGPTHKVNNPLINPFDQSDEDEEEEEEEEEAGGDADDESDAKGKKPASSESPGFRKRMSSLQLDEDHDHDAQDKRPSRIPDDRADFENFDDGMSVRGSPTPPRHKSIISRNVWTDIEKDPYQLRRNLNRNVSSTWVDVDESGNYDPEEERKKAQAKRAQAKAAKKKGKQAKAPKEKIPKLIIKLPFPNCMGTALNIVDGEDNWPDDWSEVDSDDERERKARREFYRQVTPDRPQQARIEDPAEEVDDLTGWPAARGCMQCRALGEDCTMIHGAEWPCKSCRDEDETCTPIIPPKDTIERCQNCIDNEEKFCSFEKEGASKHKGICNKCFDDHNFDCVPRPAPGYKTPRIDLDELVYGPKRKHVQCTHCRASNRRCSLKRLSDRGPCNQCKRSKIGCNFYDLPPTIEELKKQGKKKVKELEKGESSKVGAATGGYQQQPFFTEEEFAQWEAADDIVPVREATPEFELEDSEGRIGMTTHLWTSFAHPIEFRTISESSDNCHFCGNGTFGFFGHNEKRVYAIRWHNGMGYTELGGGHRELQPKTTIMCQRCTGGRMQIINCGQHEMVPLNHGESMDIDEATDGLLGAVLYSEDMHHQLQRWCSMCFSPASFKCCVQQPSLFGSDEEPLDGCGLRLCAICEGKLRSEFNGDSQAMALTVDMHPKMRDDMEEENAGYGETVVRADVGFLAESGLLWKNVLQHLQE